jgi:hypothetical protein
LSEEQMVVEGPVGTLQQRATQQAMVLGVDGFGVLER